MLTIKALEIYDFYIISGTYHDFEFLILTKLHLTDIFFLYRQYTLTAISLVPNRDLIIRMS